MDRSYRAADVDRALDGLVTGGTLTGDQASAVRAALDRGHPADSGGTIVAAYVGVGLLVAAVGTFVGQQWDELEPGGRVALFTGLTAVLAGVGLAARGPGGGVADRVRGIVWLVAVVTAGFAGAALFPDDSDRQLYASAAASLAVGVPAYALRRTPAQLLGLFGAVVMAAIAGLANADANAAGAGVTLAAIGTLALLLALPNLLPPDDVAFAVGGMLIFAGAEFLYSEEKVIGGLVAVALALVAYAVATVRADLPALLVATITVAIFGPQLLVEVFGDGLGAPVVLFLSGLVVLGAVGLHVTLVRSRD